MNNTNNLQGNEKAKKITSIALVGALLIGGTLAGTSCGKKFKKVDSTPTTIEQQVNNEQQLLLTEDFDINDEKAVNERAKAIYELSEKQVSVEDIVNLIYISNNKYDSIKFASNDDVAKFKYIQSLITTILPELLNDNLEDDANAINDSETIPADDEEVYGYMLLASGEEKAEAIELSKIVKEQLNNIKDGNTSDYEVTAKKYYEKVASLENSNLSDNTLFIMYKDINTKNPLFTMFLTKEQIECLDSNKQNTPANIVGFNITSELKLDTQKIIEEGNYGKTITPNGSAFNADDDKKAAAYAGNSKEENTTKIVDQGGAHVSSGSTSTGGSTQGSSTEESVVNNTTKDYTVVEEGGKPVGTETITEQLTVPKEENTTIVEYEEEVVELNGNYYSYKDSETTTIVKTLK